MKTDKNIDDLVQQALGYKNQDLFQKSNNILEKVLQDYPEYKKINGVMLVLAGNYYNLRLYNKAIDYSYKVIMNNPKLELASSLLYLSYFDIDEHEKAYMVLFAYLEKYPADLFKDTLKELLEGLLVGYGTNYEQEILYYSKKNNVKI